MAADQRDISKINNPMSTAELKAFDEAAFARHPALVRGYIGPSSLGEKSASGPEGVRLGEMRPERL